MPKKVVLAYSGGLDTSAIVPWLKENYDCEVVAFVADVGQGPDELVGVEEKAIKSGASECHVVDLKHDFVENYVYPTLLTGCIYEGRYLLGTSMARPVIAKAHVQVALDVGADAVCHGCTGKGNDQVRFESAFAALGPHLEIIAPWRIWDMKSREDLLAYLQERNIPMTSSVTKIYSRDRNLWHISHEGGPIEELSNEPPEDAWMLTASIAEAPDEPVDVTIGFEQGRARTLNGETLQADQLLEKLNDIAGVHGVGRVDIIENRLVGIKSRGLYETPGGTVLFEAFSALSEIVLDRDTLHFREQMALKFGDLVYDGSWFTPLREAISACAEKMAEHMTGEITVRLFKGHATAIKRASDHALYSEQFATFGEDDVYDQSHAEGFIRLFSLQSRIRALRSGGLK